MSDPGFAAVPRAVLKAQGGLSGYAKLVYALIIAHLDQNNDSWPPHKLLAAESGWGESTIRRAIKELEGAGLVEKQRGRFENHYHLTAGACDRLTTAGATRRPVPQTTTAGATDHHGRSETPAPELEPRTKATELEPTGGPGGTRPAAARPPRAVPKPKPKTKLPSASLTPLYDALKTLGVQHPRFSDRDAGAYQALLGEGLTPGDIARAYQHFQRQGTPFERKRLSLGFLGAEHLAWNWVHDSEVSPNGHARNGTRHQQAAGVGAVDPLAAYDD